VIPMRFLKMIWYSKKLSSCLLSISIFFKLNLGEAIWQSIYGKNLPPLHPNKGIQMKMLKYKLIHSPVGMLKIIANDDKLAAILWDNEKLNRVKLNEMVEDTFDPYLKTVEKQLNEYFHQRRTNFDITIDLHGTPFQKSVWELIYQIPYGSTCTYKEIAEKICNPKGGRAVGAATGKNPISIIIPCHRVIATNGSLTGFAGGLDRKKILLDLEGFRRS
jgi:methylated-DNA-[protein]-cysteine S-methyltransferase